MMLMTDVSAQAAEVLAELKAKSSEKTRITYARHGHAIDRCLGVSVAEMKLIAKRLKGQQTVAYELYETGLLEPMYLAGLVASGAKMTEPLLHAWAEGADGFSMISDYTVPWVTVEHPSGRGLAVEWIGSGREFLAASGWCTYCGLVATLPDERLDLSEIGMLLGRIAEKVHGEQNRVRLTMNNFVVAVGSYVTPLTAQAKAAALKIDTVSVDMGDTSCKVPLAIASIERAEATGKVGRKRKTIRC